MHHQADPRSGYIAFVRIQNTGQDGNGTPIFRAEGMCPRCHLRAAFSSRFVERANYPNRSIVLQCAHCHGVVVCDFYKPGQPTFDADLVYPAAQRSFPHDDSEIPELLMAALQESYSAFSVAAYTLAGIGARVVLERLVQGLGYRDRRTLEERLQDLRKSKPELEGALVHADVIRLIGNGAAHEDFRNLTRAQADATLLFVEEVLRAVYVLPALRKKTMEAFNNTDINQ